MYFDENNSFFNLDYDYTKNILNPTYTNINIDSINFNRDNKLYTPNEGFNKGNMFKNLYSKYKNHVYNLKTNNKKDELLYKIQMHNFAIRDIGLYLDLHPTNKEMLNKLEEYNKAVEKLKEQYNKEYHSLCISQIKDKSNYDWINNPWPWDKGGNK